MNAEDRSVADAVASQRDQIARLISLTEDAFRRDGRLFYVGAGTSGRLGVLDASECPPTFGSDPEMVQGLIAGGFPAILRAQAVSWAGDSGVQTKIFRRLGVLPGPVGFSGPLMARLLTPATFASSA